MKRAPNWMRKVAPTRKSPRLVDTKTGRFEQLLPLSLIAKRARPGAIFPLPIVNPADAFVPPRCREVLINDGQASFAKDATNLVENCFGVLRVMQDIAQQHRIN